MLSAVAKEIFSAKATSAQSEWDFSQAVLFRTARRSQMSAKKLSDVEILNSVVKNGIFEFSWCLYLIIIYNLLSGIKFVSGQFRWVLKMFKTVGSCLDFWNGLGTGFGQKIMTRFSQLWGSLYDLNDFHWILEWNWLNFLESFWIPMALGCSTIHVLPTNLWNFSPNFNSFVTVSFFQGTSCFVRNQSSINQ